ncbi:MAG: cytochrome c biogenesis protein CcsA [Flavobacteriaceae bacterium]
MDKKIFSFLFSTRLMAVLFLVFAASMAIGTFIEDKYNTDTARIMIYNAWWFEVIMAFFFINFLGNIKRYNLLRKEKWATLLLHLSFVLILIGAFITRYISYEGIMPIKEGQTVNQMYSDKVYLTVFVDGEHEGEMRRKTHEKPLILSQATNNDFTVRGDFSGVPYRIDYKNFIMGATEEIVEDPNGDYYLKLVESGEGTRHEHFLKEGEMQNIHNILFSFNKETEGAINIFKDENDNYSIKSPFGGNFMVMATQEQGLVYADSLQELNLRSLYTMGGTGFVLPEPAQKGKIAYTSNGNWKDKESNDALTVTVTSEGQEKEVTLLGARGSMGVPFSFKQGNLEYTLFFGSKVYDLPFSIRLNDFVADKYPGTLSSFSSFKSKITVEDETPFDYEIYMNHVLDHKGYRFFQASYNYSNGSLREAHEPDITILSVNHDFWGTWITYIGYTLLYIAMIWVIFDKNSRFGDLRKLLKKVKNKKAKLLGVLALFLGMQGFAQDADSTHVHKPRMAFSQEQVDSLINVLAVSKQHSEKFGKLVIQDEGGRMKPVNTFSSELIRKVSKSDHYKGLNSDQVFLSMTQYPDLWFEVPLIYLKKGNDSIRNILGVDKDAKYAPFIRFFDERGNYKLSPYLDAAYESRTPNSFEKDFIEANKRVVLLNAALSGKILRVFPIPNDPGNKWISFLELQNSAIKGQDSAYVRNIIPFYFHSLQEAQQTGGYKQADELLESITAYQKKFGSEVMPADQKIKSEILYNKYDIFKKLYSWYMYASLLMFFFGIMNIFYDNKIIHLSIKITQYVIGFLFILHTTGLIFRWYISGHAPWSDAYESMIYVAWSTMFFGLLLSKRILLRYTIIFDILLGKKGSALTLASTTFVTSMILMIAHWNWMDPAIANLQPVLNSYWLMIHVSIIVGSYGPFAIGMFLGVVALFLMIFTNSKNKQKMELNIKEITYINEMALTVGLVMLTIGNFLGGQWANESWGRYWGWDPKETWALVSIMVYAFVIHARLVPGLRSLWIYNLFSIVAFASIIMTYFGVNFYLSGLHSYASGDKVVTPSFVYYSIVIVAILAAVSYWKFRQFYKK